MLEDEEPERTGDFLGEPVGWRLASARAGDLLFGVLYSFFWMIHEVATVVFFSLGVWSLFIFE